MARDLHADGGAIAANAKQVPVQFICRGAGTRIAEGRPTALPLRQPNTTA
jgi:hypothetical protein